MNKLQEICAHKRDEIAARKKRYWESAQDSSSSRAFSASEAEEEIALDAVVSGNLRSFRAALLRKVQAHGYGLIAEIKKGSPSKGLIRADFDPPAHARAYEAGGAACLSVLTDEKYFQGHDDYLIAVKQACALPVLRKDFMVDPWQVHEARLIGADAILIIVAALSDAQMAEIESAALDHAMEVLVEVHDAQEFERALRLKSRLIGVNNRDLRDFSVDTNRTLEIARLAPPDVMLVAESGISSHDDLKRLAEHGVGSFLVGEALMRQPDVEAATRALLGR